MRPMSSLNRSQHGFSLLELLISVAILTLTLGVVFGYINNSQKVYRAEEQKVDTTQQGREFLDQITRDIHQAGYPGQKMYDSAILAVPPANDSRVAVGLVRVSASELWFEGDMDGDGAVESVRYTLFDNNGNAIGGASNCPCSLQRSVVLKANAAPNAQLTSYNSSVDGIINSGGLGNGGAGLAIAGVTAVGGGATVANDVFYAAYKTPPVFAAFDANGTAVALPADYVASPANLAAIRTVQITVNLMARYQDLQSHVQSVVTMTGSAKLNNF
ncbi:MAG TPA: prepilin-type N-terminal cleavage/methylation domain-containing protein [Terriglobales bacterium]|nr:prepilin-type N-terminal cleavage/methylation domain-containing protein [Terriglobales bacterium]